MPLPNRAVFRYHTRRSSERNLCGIQDSWEKVSPGVSLFWWKLLIVSRILQGFPYKSSSADKEETNKNVINREDLPQNRENRPRKRTNRQEKASAEIRGEFFRTKSQVNFVGFFLVVLSGLFPGKKKNRKIPHKNRRQDSYAMLSFLQSFVLRTRPLPGRAATCCCPGQTGVGIDPVSWQFGMRPTCPPKGSKRCFPNSVFQIPHLGLRQREKPFRGTKSA